MLLTTWLKKNGVESEALTPGVWQAVETGTLPSFHQALPRLSHEVARARRCERPLSIALIGTDEAPAPSLITLLLAALVQESLRETDIVAYAPSLALCIVGLPETRLVGARAAMSRVQALALERLMMPVRVGIAEFPTAGWTLEELIRQAEVDAIRNTPVSLSTTPASPSISTQDS